MTMNAIKENQSRDAKALAAADCILTALQLLFICRSLHIWIAKKFITPVVLSAAVTCRQRQP